MIDRLRWLNSIIEHYLWNRALIFKARWMLKDGESLPVHDVQYLADTDKLLKQYNAERKRILKKLEAKCN